MLSDGQRKGVAYERLMTDARHRADHLSSATVAASRPYLSTVQCCRGRGDSGLAVARFSRWSGAEWPMWVRLGHADHLPGPPMLGGCSPVSGPAG
jgi:hypothetical protein